MISSKPIKSPCQICGKAIETGFTIQCMGWYCDECARKGGREIKCGIQTGVC